MGEINSAAYISNFLQRNEARLAAVLPLVLRSSQPLAVIVGAHFFSPKFLLVFADRSEFYRSEHYAM